MSTYNPTMVDFHCNIECIMTLNDIKDEKLI